MKPRKYNKFIELKRTFSVPDGFGGNTISDQSVFTCWSDIATKRAYIKNEAGQTDSFVQLVFTIRNRFDIDVNPKTDFIIFLGKTYNIDSVLNMDLNNIDIEIYGSERA